MTTFRFVPSTVTPHGHARKLTASLGRLGAVSALLCLAACDTQAPTVSSAADTGGDAGGYKTVGNFACHQGHPWQAVQVSSSADVPAGGTAKISVQTPPGLPSTLTPDRMYVFCQVDEQRCTGTSCNGNPPVDFIGNHNDGLTWESVRSESGETKTVFTAIVHNSDSNAPHHATLILDVPAPQ